MLFTVITRLLSNMLQLGKVETKEVCDMCNHFALLCPPVELGHRLVRQALILAERQYPKEEKKKSSLRKNFGDSIDASDSERAVASVGRN